MSFASNLAKGFIRSAVNQVGRDGGKVVSNSIYKGRNYTPIANVGQPMAHNQINRPPLINAKQPPADAFISNKPLSGGKITICIILSMFLFPVGNVGVFIYGLLRYVDKSAKLKWIVRTPQYVQDRRYRSNTRYVGSIETTESTTIPATPEVIAINRRNGIIAMTIAVAFAVLMALSIVLDPYIRSIAPHITL